MNPLKTVMGVLLVLGAMVGARAEDRAPGSAAREGGATPKARPAPAAFAHRLWAIVDLVQANHPAPPSRQEMMAAAVKALLKAGQQPLPEDLDRRVAQLATRELFAGFLKEVWPQGADAPPTETLEATMLEGLFAVVPGHGAFYPADVVQGLEQINGNRYVGLGIQIRVSQDEHLPQIVSPLGHGPARRAGIKPGDLVLEVDGKSTRDVPLSKVVGWLKGEEGTSITVVVRSPSSIEERKLKMVRSVVPFASVHGYRRATEDKWDFHIDPAASIGYIRMGAIRSSTPHELRKIERRLRSEGVRALVLDLRSSGGGSPLHNGALVAGVLLDGSLMWSVRGRNQQVKEVRAAHECLFREWPMVVLINDGIDQTAGAVVASLQDNGRAVLVGEATRNGGFVNSILSLPDGQGALSVRTGYLERAVKGRSWPVQPDHVVPINKKQREALEQWLLSKDRLEQPGSAADKPPEDPQVARAVELLRAALKKAGT
jgi:carboxyl-terminal processing protease